MLIPLTNTSQQKWCREQHENGTYLLPEDGLSLTTITLLLTVVTSSALRCRPFLRLLVLGNLVKLVLLAFFAEGLTLLGNVNLQQQMDTGVRQVQQATLIRGRYEVFAKPNWDIQSSRVKNWFCIARGKQACGLSATTASKQDGT